ncbi:uncharacterized protein, partial [Halyomorpha halys]|uniref:uncharacterized protein n=1 Tax=Halyomorpha halys TaxID=286706 RepID=UPI0006D521C2
MRAVIVFASVLSFLALILLALTLHLTLESSPAEPALKLNSTCKFENVTGLCKSKDSCIGYPATTKLDPCNEGDLSLLCCPNHETAVSNRPKRTPGLKAKEMCRRYAKTAIKLVESPILIRGVQYINTTDCVVGEKLIKGGKNATEREFPHMVYIAKFIVDSNGLLEVCGGSIVS